MDSVQSSNQSEQLVAKNVNAPNEIEENENDLEDNLQHLISGGPAFSGSSTSSESTISPFPKPGQPLQRARESTDALNLVAITGMPASGIKPEIRANSPATTYETNLSNPLPAMAKTGVASTVGLQTPSAENAIPAGRRSGATDKIALQLADDAANRSVVSQEIKLDQLDKETKHRIVTASVNSLFERLGQPVPAGTADENARPIATPASTRRSNDTREAQLVSSSPSVEGVNRTETRSIAEPINSRIASELPAARPAMDIRQESGKPAATRGASEVQVINGAVVSVPLVETSGTGNGARPRTPIEPVIDNTANVSRIRTMSDSGAPESIIPPRSTKNVSDGILPVAQAGNGERPRAIYDTTGTADVLPISRPPVRQVTENTGVQLPPGTIAGTMIGFNRAPSANPALFSDQPLPNPKFPVPAEPVIRRAGSLDTYAGVPTPPAPEILVTRAPRSQAEQPELPGTSGSRIGETVRNTSVNGTAIIPERIGPAVIDRPVQLPGAKPISVTPEIAAGQGPNPANAHSPLKDVRQSVLNLLPASPEQNNVPMAPVVNRAPGNKIEDGNVAPVRTDVVPPAQPAGRYEVIGDKVVYTGPKGTTTDTGAAIGIVPGLTRTDSPANPVRNDGALPTTLGNRSGETLPIAKTPDGLPLDKTTRPIESNASTDRTGARLPDVTSVGNTIVPGVNAIPGTDRSLPRVSDPAVAPKLVDGRPVEVARNGETIARNGETIARNGETIARNGETIARNGETIARNGETIARNGETIARNGESTRTADSGTKIAGESIVRKEEGASRGIESTGRGSEGALKSSEGTMRVSESVAKAADPTAKSNELGAKAVEVSLKSSENARVAEKGEIAAKSSDAQVKTGGDTSAAGRPVELTGKSINETASTQKALEAGMKAAGELTAKSGDAVARGSDVNIKVQELLANNALNGDRNVRLSDAIVRAAEQAIIKGAENNQPVKLDGTVKVAEQNIQSNAIQFNAVIQGNQLIANSQQPAKVDAVRSDANAAVKGDQNQIAQNQLGPQNPLAQHNNLIAKNSDQIIAHGTKANPDCPTPAQRNIDVKVDQVVADILNHVRHNSKDQQAGAKILSSLDQVNNAANQPNDPRALLDVAAVRRILDGQGISLSPSALNTLMEGIQPTGDYAADYALPSIGSLNLSQIIGLGERLQEAVSGAGNETSEPQPKPQLQQHRTKYLVKEGDTLESIAQEKLGDARLVQLLITINRAVVNYRLEGERKVAYVVPNQYMWLPTDHELEVHKRNFFGKHGKDSSVSLAINSKQNTPLIPPVSFDHTKEVSVEVSASMQDFRPASSSSNPISGNRMSAGYEVKKAVPNAGSINHPNSSSVNETGSKMAGNLDKLRHAGDRKSVNLDEIEYLSTQVSHRQCYQVREGESLMSIAASLESMGHISMWKLLAKINGFQIEEGDLGKPAEKLHAGQFIVLPTTEELNEYKLLEKLTSTSKAAVSNVSVAENAFNCVQYQRQIETPPPPALVALAQGVGGLTTVQKLSNFTRLVFNDLPHLENCFSITVEARWNGQWKPMASYECRHGQTTRHLYNKHGEIKSMEVELPPFVVKEMAKEDFVRNWNAYVNSFMGDIAIV